MEKNKQLLEILTEISEGKGAYNEDRLIHASNTIEDMKRLALDGIKLLQEEEPPDFSSMQQLADSISLWSDATFGYAQRTIPIINHLKNEIEELVIEVKKEEAEASMVDREIGRAVWEFADCMMLLLDAITHHGITMGTMMQAVSLKLEANKRRKWGKPDENGVIEHLREEDTP